MNEYFLTAVADMIRRELLDPERVPIHEAGHAVVAHYHRYQVIKATVQPNYFPDDPGDMCIGQVDYNAPWPDDDEATYAVWHSRARVMAEVSLAGRAAEIAMFGELKPSDGDGHAFDLEGVRHLLEALYAPKSEIKIHAYIERAETKAGNILRRNWPAVTRIAAELQNHRILDHESLQSLLEGVPFRAVWESDKRWVKKVDPYLGECYESAG